MTARVAPRAPGPSAFPRLRWIALAWLLVWTPAYAYGYGWANFLNLCDLAVILTCAGLWLGSPLLLSTQAVSSLVVLLVWDLDVAWRAITGRHLIGGTEYMWDARFPLALRLLSLFHVVWPPLLWWALRRVGYDKRALLAQSAFALVVLIAVSGGRCRRRTSTSRIAIRSGTGPGDPPPCTSASPPSPSSGCVYAPIHALLRRAMPQPQARAALRTAPGA